MQGFHELNSFVMLNLHVWLSSLTGGRGFLSSVQGVAWHTLIIMRVVHLCKSSS